jgi:hypothetical protein
MRFGRGAKTAVAIATAALGLSVAAGDAAAQDITPHVVTPHSVTPHAVTPAPAPASESPPAEPTESAEPTEPAESMEATEPAEATAPTASPDASPQRPPMGQEGPSSGPEEPGSSSQCPGPECDRCPGSDKCPDSEGNYGPDSPHSTLTDDPRYAVCASSQFLMLWAWPDNIMEHPYIGFLLKALVVTGGVENPKYPRHPGAAPGWDIPRTAMLHLSDMVNIWNRDCMSFVTP